MTPSVHHLAIHQYSSLRGILQHKVRISRRSLDTLIDNSPSIYVSTGQTVIAPVAFSFGSRIFITTTESPSVNIVEFVFISTSPTNFTSHLPSSLSLGLAPGTPLTFRDLTSRLPRLGHGHNVGRLSNACAVVPVQTISFNEDHTTFPGLRIAWNACLL
jgi:hypothetical protein